MYPIHHISRGQEILETSLADASILCTALGGGHNKDTSPLWVAKQPCLLLFLPETILQNLRIITQVPVHIGFLVKQNHIKIPQSSGILKTGFI